MSKLIYHHSLPSQHSLHARINRIGINDYIAAALQNIIFWAVVNPPVGIVQRSLRDRNQTLAQVQAEFSGVLICGSDYARELHRHFIAQNFFSDSYVHTQSE